MKSQKITTTNYFETINKIGFENLPLVLKQSHTVILTKTDNGEDWSKYKNDDDLKRMIDLVFNKLEEFMASKKSNLSGTEDFDAVNGNSKNEKPKQEKRKNPYSEISTEIKFIQRFLDFHDKILYKKTFEIFIDELQKAIQEKKITKKSPVAKDVVAIQTAVISAFNSMKNAKHFVLKPTTIKHFKSIIEKYENAYDDIDETYTKVKKKSVGLNGIQNEGKIMSSLDFANLQFSTIGLKDKWLEFIGDPAPGFTAMVYGRPKMGKSYLCVDFAGYLARNHGKVLYVAKEEKLDATLQKKLKDKDVANENLFVADNLPKSLSGYQFVFLDSVNKLGLSPQELTKLKTDNPGVSFIYIFQTTKEGKFRGTNEFQHDVDVVIEVPEKGIAVQNGRFNQGGEMRIFDDAISGENDLSGIKKVKKKPMCEPVIEIKTEFSIPLEELAMELIPPKKPQNEIVNLLHDHSQKADKVVKKLIVDFISDEKVNITITKVKFNQMDSVRLTHGVAYFDAYLKGVKSELKKIADNDLLFNYDWENPQIDGLSKGEKIIRIKPTFSIPLQEFDFLIERGETVQEAIRANKREAEQWVQKLAEDQIKKSEASVKVDNVYFMTNDDEADEEEEGLSYYDLRISGTEQDLKKVAGKDKDLYYLWPNEDNINGIKANSVKHNLTLRKNVSLLDGTKNKAMKKNINKKDWTEPEWLNQADWHNLKIIKKYVEKGDYKSAMDHARNCDTVIREEIPPDIWKKMGGQLTKTGEEKLKADQKKAETIEKIGKELTVKLEKHSWGELAVLRHGKDWHAILHPEHLEKISILKTGESFDADDEQGYKWLITNNGDGYNIKSKFGNNKGHFKLIDRTPSVFPKNFDPTKYADRKDDHNPTYIFSLTSSQVLAEALRGEFDLNYLVRRELANRGQDSKGKWVGFDRAKEIHKV